MKRLAPVLVAHLAVAAPNLLSATAASPAAPPAESRSTDAERLQRVGEIAAARRVLREHDSGKNPATPADLDAARATLRRAGLSEQPPAGPKSAPRRAAVTLVDANMETVAALCAAKFGGQVTVSESLARRTVTLRLSAPTDADLLPLLRAELLRQGIALRDVQGGRVLQPAQSAPPAK